MITGTTGTTGNNRKKRDDNDKRPQPRGPAGKHYLRRPNSDWNYKELSKVLHAREVLLTVGGPPKKAKIGVTISFGDEDLEGIKFPHDDPSDHNARDSATLLSRVS